MKEAKNRPAPRGTASNPEVEAKDKKSLNELAQHLKDVNETKSFAQTRKMITSIVREIVVANNGKSEAKRSGTSRELAKARAEVEKDGKFKKAERKKLLDTIDKASSLIKDQNYYFKSLSLERLKIEKDGIVNSSIEKKNSAVEEAKNIKLQASTEASKIIEEAKEKAKLIKEEASSEAEARRTKVSKSIKKARNKNKELMAGREDNFSSVKAHWKNKRDEEEQHFKDRKAEFATQKEEHRTEHQKKMDLLKSEREEFVQWKKTSRKATKDKLVEMRQDHRHKLKERRDAHNQKLIRMRNDFRDSIRSARKSINSTDKKAKLRRDKSKRYFNDLKESFYDASPVIGTIADMASGVSGMFGGKKDKSEQHLSNIDENLKTLLVEEKHRNNEDAERRLEKEKATLKQVEADRERGFGAGRVAANDPQYNPNANPAAGEGGNGLIHAALGMMAANLFGKVRAGASKVGTAIKSATVAAGKATLSAGKGLAYGTTAAKGGIVGAAATALNPTGAALATSKAAQVAGGVAKMGKLARLSGIVNLVYSVYAIGDGIVNAERMFGKKVAKTDVLRRTAGGVIGFMSSFVELADIATFGKTNFKEKFEKGAASMVEGYIDFFGKMWDGIKSGDMTAIFKAVKEGFVKMFNVLADLIPGVGLAKSVWNAITGDGKAKDEKKITSDSGPITSKAQTVKAKKAEVQVMKAEEAKPKPAPKSSVVMDNSVKTNNTTILNSKLSTRNNDVPIYTSLYGPPKLITH